MRCHANAAGLGGNVSPAVQLSFPAAWTLYANGVPIGTSGDLSSGYFPTFAIRTFSIPPPLTGGPLVLALRFVIRDVFAEALPQPTIGPASALNEHRDVLILAGIRSFAFSFTSTQQSVSSDSSCSAYGSSIANAASSSSLACIALRTFLSGSVSCRRSRISAGQAGFGGPLS